MPKASTRRGAAAGFCLVAAALYAYGVLSASAIPPHIEGAALPLDLMVGVPLGFYLLIVRPRKLTLLTIIPVIWLSYGLSALALGSPDAGILPLLLAVLIPVEAAIAIRECTRIVRVFKMAKARSADPMVWFRETMRYLVRKDLPASVAAAELSVWYYALLSWRKCPYVLPGEQAFSYHRAGGYLSMMLGLALAFPVEIVAVHLLLSQWSVTAAIVVTALSVYAAVWLAGDARARVLRPVVLSEDAVRLACGIQMEAVIPLADVEAAALSESGIEGVKDSDKLNYGTFYQPNVWLVTKRPIEMRTLLGKKRALAIGLTLDDPRSFAVIVNKYVEALAQVPIGSGHSVTYGLSLYAPQ